MSIYAKPEFHWGQMGIIRSGLEDGIDVSVYTNPTIEWLDMNTIRKGLIALKEKEANK